MSAYAWEKKILQRLYKVKGRYLGIPRYYFIKGKIKET